MRLELTRRTDLALQALRTLVAGDGPWKAGELAVALGTSAAFVPHVVSPLTRAGWVRSAPGPRGGYRATDSAAAVSVLQLIEAVEGPVRADRCVLREQPCPATVPCALHDAWMPARDALVERLATAPVAAQPPRGGSGRAGRDD